VGLIVLTHVIDAGKLVCGATLLALLLASCQSAPPAPRVDSTLTTLATVTPSSSATAHVDLTQGTAEWRADSDSAWQPVTGALDLPVGGEIRTGIQGQVTLTLPESSGLTLQPSTQIGVEALELEGDQPAAITSRLARLHLNNGAVAFDLKSVPGPSAFEFRTDDLVAVIRGTTGTISSQVAVAGQPAPGDFNLVMTQGTALVGCVVHNATFNAPEVNVLQAGLGQPVHPTSGQCQSVQSMPDPARATGLLDAYGVALSGPTDVVSAVANGDLPGALDKLTQAWGHPIPPALLPAFAIESGSTPAERARALSNGTVLQILQPAVPPPGPQGPQGPLGPSGPSGRRGRLVRPVHQVQSHLKLATCKLPERSPWEAKRSPTVHFAPTAASR
jgi:hypothetical protein